VWFEIACGVLFLFCEALGNVKENAELTRKIDFLH
jgi:hypothetical protein